MERMSRTGTDYDSSVNMYQLFSGRDHNPDDSLEAIELAVVNKDKSMVPVLIEMLRFFEDYVPRIESRKALIAITGREVKGNEGLWKNWMEWLVENADEYQPPAGYLEWKIALMSLIDPRFRDFLAPAAEGSRINVFEIAWGGVRPDGDSGPSECARWFRRRSRTTFSLAIESSACPSTGSTGRTRFAS